MAEIPNILLTNDDGIESPGLQALKSCLSPVADVTIIAPSDNQSGTGRSHSRQFNVLDHPTGIEVTGKPCDCVIYGTQYLEKDFDLVVSGCNDGPNIGEVKIHRSGTVSAAAEAAYLDVPAISVSLYDPSYPVRQDFDREDFDRGAKPIKHLVENFGEIFRTDNPIFLNVNIPNKTTEQLWITRPLSKYQLSVTQEAEKISVKKEWYAPLLADYPTEMLTKMGEKDTDRRALAEGVVSISPLANHHVAESPGNIDAVIKEFHPDS